MSPAQATVPASSRPLILIVDDMPDIRDMYAEYLPELDGWEATRRLKANDLTRSIPVIALTGLSVRYSKSAALQAGCDGFLTKPCYPDALADEIRRVLRRWRRSH